ncbi:MAG TPA: LapA family protein [Clostridiaceae bacterium]|nr:LapA family protein [Clostridiaceae bacterium]
MSDQIPKNKTSNNYNPSPEKKPMRVTFKQIVLVIALVLFIIFAATNREQVRVNFLVLEIEAPLVVIIVFAFLIGMLVSWLMHTLKKNK